MIYSLDNAETRSQTFPETFLIPERAKRDALLPGELVKLMFLFSPENGGLAERMWVLVKSRTDGGGYIGTLDNNPTCTTKLRAGAEVAFGPEHVTQIYEEPAQA